MVQVEVYPAEPAIRTNDTENIFVVRKYETHWETWFFCEVEATQLGVPGWLRKDGLQDREGKWWLLYHDFHHVREEVTRNWQQMYEDYAHKKRTWMEL